MNSNQALSRHAGILLLALLAGCQTTPTQADPNRGEAAIKRALDGKALWEEKCRSVAGEKIYRKVENVEGLLLMKVRPQRGDRELSDRNWPGAAFARESPDDGYITSFLAYEHAFGPALHQETAPPISSTNRGYVNTDRRPGGLPGYRWVEVIDDKDGQRYRYTGRWEEPWQNDKTWLKGYIKFYLDKTPSSSPPPRYGITYEDHVIPEERELGIASSTIKVLDLKTSEVLGEMTRYAWSPSAPSRVNPVPWLTAYRCPQRGWTGADSRQFVDQVLIPAKEK